MQKIFIHEQHGDLAHRMLEIAAEVIFFAPSQCIWHKNIQIALSQC
jgi:hypothetical protein